MTIQLPAYTLEILNGNEEITTGLLVAFAVGVGIGSLLCERMSGHRIELGLVPFGSIGLSLFAIDLYFAQPAMHVVAVDSVGEFLVRPGSWRILMDLALLGAFGGFYSVPLYALIQNRTDRQHLSRVIAANNIINALFMVVAAVLAFAVLAAGMTIPQFYLILAVLNAMVAIYIFTLLPEFLMRFLVWILVNMLYRVRSAGLENIPERGPAVLVCNHVSFVDALLVGGSIRRPVRFVMYFRIFQIPLLRFIFRTAKAIPIASAKEDEALLARAFDKIDEELAEGHLVCIFPEGGITRDAVGSAGKAVVGFAKFPAGSGQRCTFVSVNRSRPGTPARPDWNSSFGRSGATSASVTARGLRPAPPRCRVSCAIPAVVDSCCRRVPDPRRS
jgi:1-acyl-sn-glycerol-3-phosphate acyltransferase